MPEYQHGGARNRDVEQWPPVYNFSDSTFEKIEQNSGVLLLNKKLKQIAITEENNPFLLYRFLSSLSDIFENDVYPFSVSLLSVRTQTEGSL